MHHAVTVIRCVNCGSGTDWPTWIALVFGAVAAFAAARSLRIQSREYGRLTDELTKRADFEITLRPADIPGMEIGEDAATYTSPGTNAHVRLEIGISNTGTRAGTHTTVNLLAGDRSGSLQWCDPTGHVLLGQLSPAPAGERLSDDDTAPATIYISADIDRVALRTPWVLYALLMVDVPSKLYLRAKVQSDDLPEDVPERVKDYVVHFVHGNPS